MRVFDGNYRRFLQDFLEIMKPPLQNFSKICIISKIYFLRTICGMTYLVGSNIDRFTSLERVNVNNIQKCLSTNITTSPMSITQLSLDPLYILSTFNPQRFFVVAIDRLIDTTRVTFIKYHYSLNNNKSLPHDRNLYYKEGLQIKIGLCEQILNMF